MGMVMSHITSSKYKRTADYSATQIGCMTYPRARGMRQLRCAATCKQVQCVMFGLTEEGCVICMKEKVAPYLNPPPGSRMYVERK